MVQTNVPLRYLENDRNLAVYRASLAGGDLVEHDGNYIDIPVSIENGRHLDTDLDREGFVLARQETKVSDFYADAAPAQYEQEVKATLSQITGSSDILVFDHTRRSSSAQIRTHRTVREASSVIHNDYSGSSGFTRLADYLEDEGIKGREEYLQRDFAIINLWRSIAQTIANFPLAMCFANSVSSEDLVAVERVGKERTGEIQLALHNPAHRWCYFPQMQRDEVLLFKTFDSREDGRARFTIHTSFDDPDAAAGAAPRESMETRCFVFF